MSMLLVLGALVLAAAAQAHPPAGVSSATPMLRPPSGQIGERAIDEIQAVVAAAQVEAWLVCDRAGQDPHALELVRPRSKVPRRWCYLVPATGEPVLLASRWDTAAFERLPGRRIVYRDGRELDGQLRGLLRGRKRVALDARRIDGATLDKLRGGGATLVPAMDLVTRALGRWGEAERASHERVAAVLPAVKDAAVRFIAERLGAGSSVNEYEVQQLIRRELTSRGLESERAVVVAAGASGADPQYVPSARRSASLELGELVRLEIGARERGRPEAVYAELMWMIVLADRAPERAEAAFGAVRKACERAIELISERRAKRRPLQGWEVDAAARAVLEQAGLGEQAFTPVGRSLGRAVEGSGPLLDDVDVHDEGEVLGGTAYSIAPGVFFTGEFGVRSGVNVLVGDEGAEVLGWPVQAAIEPIFAAPAQPVEIPPAAAPTAALPGPVAPAAPATRTAPAAPAPQGVPGAPAAPATGGKPASPVPSLRVPGR